MNDLLAWALRNARDQTLTLVADIDPTLSASQSAHGERHPLWILGHLLLGDVYLLSLLDVEPLSSDFETLLRRYGPASMPTPALDDYDSKVELAERMSSTGTRRLEAIHRMTPADLRRAMPDPGLVKAQPTIAHHLQALVCHEGYHAGQRSAWRRARGLTPTRSAFAPA